MFFKSKTIVFLNLVKYENKQTTEEVVALVISISHFVNTVVIKWMPRCYQMVN